MAERRRAAGGLALARGARGIGIGMAVCLALAVTIALGTAQAAAPAGAREAQSASANPALEARMLVVAGELRCLVCQNETIAASQADLAADLRQEIREMISRGMTDAQIRKYMTDRYGDFVLYKPPFRPSTALLWLGPPALLVGALVGLTLTLRRRQRAPADAFDPETPDDAIDLGPTG